MSLPGVLERVAEIHGLLQPQRATPATSSTAFAAQLSAAAPMGGTGLATPTPTAMTAMPLTTGGTGAGQAIVNLVRQEIGQAEQPPGSNDSPRIAQYRQATAGSGVGPWCAYFTSWAARQAGVPLGDTGQGFGRVDDVWAWAERSGKAVPAAAGPPQPGDLIVWDEHIGVVESVGTDGTVKTIEGNSSDAVSQRTYGPDGGGAIGYVRLG